MSVDEEFFATSDGYLQTREPSPTPTEEFDVDTSSHLIRYELGQGTPSIYPPSQWNKTTHLNEGTSTSHPRLTSHPIDAINNKSPERVPSQPKKSKHCKRKRALEPRKKVVCGECRRRRIKCEHDPLAVHERTEKILSQYLIQEETLDQGPSLAHPPSQQNSFGYQETDRG